MIIKKLLFVLMMFSIIIIIIGISVAVYGYTEHEKYREIWWNSNDPDESIEAFDKMGYYMLIQFVGIGISFAGIFLTSCIGIYYYLYNEESESTKKYRTANKTQESQIEVRVLQEGRSSVAYQTIICPYCGSKVILKINKQDLKGESIECKNCNSYITL